MKRGILLILALLLILDLAEDGCLGKAKLVDSQSSAETSLSSSLLDCSGKVDPADAPPSQGGEISCLKQCQAVIPLVQSALKIIIYNHTGSSGGIPQ
jgi:hypothetical protein